MSPLLFLSLPAIAGDEQYASPTWQRSQRGHTREELSGALTGPQKGEHMTTHKTWDFLDLKRELLAEDRRMRETRAHISSTLKQSKGWKAKYSHKVPEKDFGPFDGARVLKHLREVA